MMVTGISLDKKYRTESGTKVVIYAVYPDQEVSQVHGALVYSSYTQPQSWSILGFFHEAGEGRSTLDLVEVVPYEDWKIDDKVIVWNSDTGVSYRRYFAGIDRNGNITTFVNGNTSWTNAGGTPSAFKYGRLAENSDE